MPDPNLVNFINSARIQGQNDQNIKQQLLNSGWAENDINQALYPQPQATPIAQTPPIQNTSPILQAQPQTNYPTNLQGLQKNQNPSGGFPKIAIFIVIGLVVLGIVGAAIFFFLNSSKTSSKPGSGNTSSSGEKVNSKYVFDVPALINKDGQSVKKALGKPKEESTYNGQISLIGYAKGDYEANVYYTPDFSSNNDKLHFSYISINVLKSLEKSKILNDLNLSESDSTYGVIFNQNSYPPNDIYGVIAYQKGSKYFDPKIYSDDK